MRLRRPNSPVWQAGADSRGRTALWVSSATARTTAGELGYRQAEQQAEQAEEELERAHEYIHQMTRAEASPRPTR